MASACPSRTATRSREVAERNIDRLAGIPAHDRTGGSGVGPSSRRGPALGLLDRLLALALEVRCRSDGRLADCSAADRARILRPGRSWFPQPTGTLVAVFDRAHFGIYLHGTRDRLDPLQPAVCGAALRCFVLVGRPEVARSLRYARGFTAAHLLPRGGSAFRTGPRHRRGPRVRAHHGRVWSGADDWRQYSGRDAHRLHRYLRSGAGFELCLGECHGVAAAGVLLRRADAGLPAESEKRSSWAARSKIIGDGSGQISETRCLRLRKRNRQTQL